MFWINVLLLILIGGLAAAPGFARKNNAVRDAYKALKPFEGWIGLVGVAWGLWGVINMVIHIKLISVVPIFWIFNVLIAVLMLTLGFVLGMPVLESLLSKTGGAPNALTEQHRKLAPRRESLGTSALITAALSVLLYLLKL